jgi:hypothetical protein
MLPGFPDISSTKTGTDVCDHARPFQWSMIVTQCRRLWTHAVDPCVQTFARPRTTGVLALSGGGGTTCQLFPSQRRTIGLFVASFCPNSHTFVPDDARISPPATLAGRPGILTRRHREPSQCQTASWPKPEPTDPAAHALRGPIAVTLPMLLGVLATWKTARQAAAGAAASPALAG